MEDVRDSDHITICGWNESGISLIQGLFHQCKPKVPDYIVTKNDAAIVPGPIKQGEASILEKPLDLVTGSGRGEG